MKSPLTHLAAAAGLVAIGLAVAPGGVRADDSPSPVPAVEAEPPAEAAPCALQSASVDRGTATFTVGPEACEGEVGPFSFSAFELPGGWRVPFADQELIAHHGANGSTYGAGSYTVTLELGDVCNWQTDLYRGDSAVPVFGDKLIDADYLEGRVCDTETTTTVAAETGGPTTSVAGEGGSATTTTTVADDRGGDTTTTTTTTASTTTTVSDQGGATTTTSVAGESGGPTTTTDADSGGPTTTQAVGDTGGTRTLPQTGPDETLMIGVLGGALLGLGALARRLART